MHEYSFKRNNLTKKEICLRSKNYHTVSYSVENRQDRDKRKCVWLQRTCENKL